MNAAALTDAAVVDTNVESLNACADASGCEAFTSLEQGLAWGPDGIIIATPHDTHLTVAEAALSAQAHLLIEKPVAADEAGVAVVLRKYADLHLRVFTACNLRFHPAVALLRANLPLVGRPYFSRAHYGNYLPNMRPGADYRELYCAQRQKGGGVILDAIHEIDYLTWFFGPVSSVSCVADRLSDLEIDVEDFASITLSHAGGTRSIIELDYLRATKRRGCEIVGDLGTISWESNDKGPEHCLVKLKTRDMEDWQVLLDTTEIDANQAYCEMLEHFVAAIGSGAEVPLLDGETALAELQTALSCLSAAQCGRSILT